MEYGSNGKIRPYNVFHLLSTPDFQISCSVQAKHNIVGARTEKRRSEDLVAGLDVNQGSGTVLVKEGGGTVSIPVRSTVPVLCPPQDRAFGECCLHLELALREVEEEQLCPQGNVMDRVSVGVHFNCFLVSEAEAVQIKS